MAWRPVSEAHAIRRVRGVGPGWSKAGQGSEFGIGGLSCWLGRDLCLGIWCVGVSGVVVAADGWAGFGRRGLGLRVGARRAAAGEVGGVDDGAQRPDQQDEECEGGEGGCEEGLGSASVGEGRVGECGHILRIASDASPGIRVRLTLGSVLALTRLGGRATDCDL